MIFPSENFIVITHLLRWSIYITHKKDITHPTDSTYAKSAPAFIYVMLYSIFKMECTALIFLFEKQLFKEHSLRHTFDF